MHMNTTAIVSCNLAEYKDSTYKCSMATSLHSGLHNNPNIYHDATPLRRRVQRNFVNLCVLGGLEVKQIGPPSKTTSTRQ
jgi:hypothetical protein